MRGTFVAVALALLPVLAPAPVAAQHSRAGVSTGGILVSDNQSGPFVYADFTYPLGPVVALSAGVGVADATNVSFRPERPLAWHQRRFVVADLAAQTDVVTFRTGRLAHSVGFKLGLTFRRRDEERPLASFGPDVLRSTSFDLAAEMARLKADDFRTFTVADGRHGIATFTDRGAESGTLLAFQYAATFRGVRVGAEVGYRKYNWGTPIISYGLTAGMHL